MIDFKRLLNDTDILSITFIGGGNEFYMNKSNYKDILIENDNLYATNYFNGEQIIIDLSKIMAVKTNNG